MEFYDEILKLLKDTKENQNENQTSLNRLKSIFETEPAKELYLIIADYFSQNSELSTSFLLQISFIIRTLFLRLSSANEFLLSECFDLFYRLYSPLQEKERESLIQDWFLPDISLPQYYLQFLSLISEKPPSQFIDLIDPSHKHYNELVFYRLSLLSPQKFNKISTNISVEYLLSSKINFLIKEGLTFISNNISKFNNPTIFKKIILIAPYLPTQIEAIETWNLAKNIYFSFTEVNQFNLLRECLENGDISDTMREGLIQLLLEEIKKPKHGIFRSPMVTSLLNVIVPCTLR